MAIHGPGPVAPTAGEAGRALAVRVLLPAVALFVVVLGAGYLIVDVIGLDEHAISEGFVDARTPTMNTVTAVVSEMGNTQVLTATCLIVVAFIWWRSHQWWFAIVPVIALATEVLVFITASAIVGRSRPDVEQLDSAPPTSSFPSGHTGASTAVYIAFALCASRIRHTGLRVTVQVVCVLVPLGVALSRVYRGMHHPTDVAAGLLVGVTCAVIAWGWLPTRDAAELAVRADAAASAARTDGPVGRASA